MYKNYWSYRPAVYLFTILSISTLQKCLKYKNYGPLLHKTSLFSWHLVMNDNFFERYPRGPSFFMHRWNKSPVNIYYQAISIMLSFFAFFSDTTAKNAWLFTKSILTCYNTKKVSITFFFTKWFACTMPAFTIMLQIGFLTCKREICFSTNIHFSLKENAIRQVLSLRAGKPLMNHQRSTWLHTSGTPTQSGLLNKL